MNEKFSNACNRVAQDCPPVWMMRQAGRYHSHYQNLKEKHTFEELCKTPELAAEVALGPIQEFDFDVSILFSDILFPFEGLGLNLQYNPGPQFEEKVSPDNHERYMDLERAVDFLKFQGDAVKATRAVLPSDKSLIGFVGGPWTMMTYGVEERAPIEFKDRYLKAVVLPLIKEQIILQLEAGAEKVLVIDSGLDRLGRTYLKETYTHLLNELTSYDVAYYCKGLTTDITPLVLNKYWGGVGVDSAVDISQVMGNFTQGFVQGNFDENYLLYPTDRFERQLDQFCGQMQELDRTGWVCGLGHGINKNTPEKHVHQFVDKIRSTFN